MESKFNLGDVVRVVNPGLTAESPFYRDGVVCRISSDLNFETREATISYSVEMFAPGGAWRGLAEDRVQAHPTGRINFRPESLDEEEVRECLALASAKLEELGFQIGIGAQGYHIAKIEE